MPEHGLEGRPRRFDRAKGVPLFMYPDDWCVCVICSFVFALYVCRLPSHASTPSSTAATPTEPPSSRPRRPCFPYSRRGRGRGGSGHTRG